MTKEWEAAIREGDSDRVSNLISGGADIDSRDRHGQTGLMVASMKGHTQVVQLLVEHGTDLNVTAKYNLSALMLAVINGHAEIAKILAQAGADQQIRGTGAPGFWGKTALDLAKNAGREEIVSILQPKT